MGKSIYVNEDEYDFLIRVIEDAMLTQGELDSTWYDNAHTILVKLGYPKDRINEIDYRLMRKDFRFNRPRCCQEKDVNDAAMKARNGLLDELDEWASSDDPEINRPAKRKGDPIHPSGRLRRKLESMRSGNLL